MSISFLLWLLAAAVLAAIWVHHANLSRKAVFLARQYVQHQGLQFLDQSAVLCRLGVTNKGDGHKIRRTYRFEFSARGDRRYNGWITLTGGRLSEVELEPFPEPVAPEPLVRDPTIH